MELGSGKNRCQQRKYQMYTDMWNALLNLPQRVWFGFLLGFGLLVRFCFVVCFGFF